MSASIVSAGPRAKAAHLKELAQIKLHHGEAVWLMAHLGFQGAASDSTFYEYIKSLRKLGIPFGKIGAKRRGLANYSYCHLMELALVLTTRVYYFVPDTILTEIIRHRRTLYSYYLHAYRDHHAGLGNPIRLSAPHQMSIAASGIFLDLQIDFSGGILSRFGPPVLLSPYQAVAAFVEQNIATRSLLPINLSLMAQRLVDTAKRAPVIRTGPGLTNRDRDARLRLG
jgi:hypothetical protein